MAAKKKATEEQNERQAAVTPTEQAVPGQEEGHVEDAREQTPETAETQETAPDPEKDVEAPALQSLSELAARHRVASWQQAALVRFMGWADGKMLTDEEYRVALNSLTARHLGGGRRK